MLKKVLLAVGICGLAAGVALPVQPVQAAKAAKTAAGAPLTCKEAEAQIPQRPEGPPRVQTRVQDGL